MICGTRKGSVGVSPLIDHAPLLHLVSRLECWKVRLEQGGASLMSHRWMMVERVCKCERLSRLSCRPARSVCSKEEGEMKKNAV